MNPLSLLQLILCIRLLRILNENCMVQKERKLVSILNEIYKEENNKYVCFPQSVHCSSIFLQFMFTKYFQYLYS